MANPKLAVSRPFPRWRPRPRTFAVAQPAHRDHKRLKPAFYGLTGPSPRLPHDAGRRTGRCRLHGKAAARRACTRHDRRLDQSGQLVLHECVAAMHVPRPGAVGSPPERCPRRAVQAGVRAPLGRLCAAPRPPSTPCVHCRSGCRDADPCDAQTVALRDVRDGGHLRRRDAELRGHRAPGAVPGAADDFAVPDAGAAGGRPRVCAAPRGHDAAGHGPSAGTPAPRPDSEPTPLESYCFAALRSADGVASRRASASKSLWPCSWRCRAHWPTSSSSAARGHACAAWPVAPCQTWRSRSRTCPWASTR